MRIFAVDFELDVTNSEQWTSGRWARPIDEIWKQWSEEMRNYDVLAFPIQTDLKIWKRKFTEKHKCTCCEREFIIHNAKQTLCGYCFLIRMCDTCNNVFITQASYKRNKTEEDGKTFCSKECRSSYATERMVQWMRDSPERVSKHISNLHKDNTGKKWCPVCDEVTSHLMGVGCMTCFNRKPENRETSSAWMTQWRNPPETQAVANTPKFCKKCGKVTSHKFYTCLVCYPGSGFGDQAMPIIYHDCPECGSGNAPHG